MINFGYWMDPYPYPPVGSVDPIETAEFRAILAWHHINENPTIVVFAPSGGAPLAPQVVRIESDSGVQILSGIAGVAPYRRVIIFGVRDHPSVPDTDVDEGYRFVYMGDQYRVTDVLYPPGEVQAIVQAVG